MQAAQTCYVEARSEILKSTQATKVASGATLTEQFRPKKHSQPKQICRQFYHVLSVATGACNSRIARGIEL
jgi:hypothetical protein